MKVVASAVIAAVLFVSIPHAAHAGVKTLTSPPLANSEGGSIACVITNVGSKPVTLLKVDIGTVGVAVGVENIVTNGLLTPGESAVITGLQNQGYCRFTIDRSPKTVRAAACRFLFEAPVGNTTDCLEAR